MDKQMADYRKAVDALLDELALQNKAFWDAAIEACLKF